MKRLLLLAGAAALCTLTLFAVYCADVKYDNPLDQKAHDEGKNDHWLWEIKEPDCEGLIGIPSGVNCGQYIRNWYFNPLLDTTIKKEWDKKLGCAGKNELKITLEGLNPATLYNNQTSEFARLMGRSASGWKGVIQYPDDAYPIAVLTKNGTDPYDDQENMPPVGTSVIRYIATRPKCEDPNKFDSTYETRQLNVLQYTADDTVRPNITFSGCQDVLIEKQPIIGNVHSCVSAGVNNTLTWEIRLNGAVVDSVRTTVPAIFSITYKACKNLIVGGNPVQACTTRVRTVTVREDQQQVIDPPAVIVLNKYAYNIGAKPFLSPDTAFGGTAFASFVDKGVAEAYYINASGVKTNIDKARVRAPTPAPFDPNRVDGNDVIYTLDASSGEYARATATRKVYITTDVCAGTPTMNIDFRTASGGSIGDGPNTITLPAGTAWSKPTDSFRVTGADAGGFIVNSLKFGVDFGTLNPDKPVAGTYTINYIGLSECSKGTLQFLRSAERTVIVQ
jgi:hypothetical protein